MVVPGQQAYDLRMPTNGGCSQRSHSSAVVDARSIRTGASTIVGRGTTRISSAATTTARASTRPARTPASASASTRIGRSKRHAVQHHLNNGFVTRPAWIGSYSVISWGNACVRFCLGFQHGERVVLVSCNIFTLPRSRAIWSSIEPRTVSKHWYQKISASAHIQSCVLNRERVARAPDRWEREVCDAIGMGMGEGEGLGRSSNKARHDTGVGRKAMVML